MSYNDRDETDSCGCESTYSENNSCGCECEMHHDPCRHECSHREPCCHPPAPIYVRPYVYPVYPYSYFGYGALNLRRFANQVAYSDVRYPYPFVGPSYM